MEYAQTQTAEPRKYKVDLFIILVLTLPSLSCKDCFLRSSENHDGGGGADDNESSGEREIMITILSLSTQTMQ